MITNILITLMVLYQICNVEPKPKWHLVKLLGKHGPKKEDTIKESNGRLDEGSANRAFGFGGCDAIFTILSEKGKNAIVSKHNELRRKVAKGKELGQPPAANMREMVWSEELAEFAQNSINSDPTCFPKHDNSDMYGQNIGMEYANYEEQDQSTAELLFPKIVDRWYNEVQFFRRSPSKFTYKPVDGHYTQVVWADSYEVGCGTAYYPKDDQFYISMVCNYRVSGNIVPGESLYIEGKACSACPDGTSCSNGLCA